MNYLLVMRIILFICQMTNVIQHPFVFGIVHFSVLLMILHQLNMLLWMKLIHGHLLVNKDFLP